MNRLTFVSLGAHLPGIGIENVGIAIGFKAVPTNPKCESPHPQCSMVVFIQIFRRSGIAPANGRFGGLLTAPSFAAVQPFNILYAAIISVLAKQLPLPIRTEDQIDL